MIVKHPIVASLDPSATGITYTRHLTLNDGALTRSTKTVPKNERKTCGRCWTRLERGILHSVYILR